jgi:hypothetical protein
MLWGFLLGLVVSYRMTARPTTHVILIEVVEETDNWKLAARVAAQLAKLSCYAGAGANTPESWTSMMAGACAAMHKHDMLALRYYLDEINATLPAHDRFEVGEFGG